MSEVVRATGRQPWVVGGELRRRLVPVRIAGLTRFKKLSRGWIRRLRHTGR